MTQETRQSCIEVLGVDPQALGLRGTTYTVLSGGDEDIVQLGDSEGRVLTLRAGGDEGWASYELSGPIPREARA